MLKKITNLFDRREYIGWKEYHEQVMFMENFYWQQETRRKSLKNTTIC